ncbi:MULTISPECIES: hypothetical protein [Comamonas]|uniref:hypothetical protein n=1 Tax=Comamonas TaxID=283 RepID=UPI00257A028A|nr:MULTISPECIES: hypothetical protein [Comamonas]
MDFPKSVPGVGLVGGEFVDEDASTGRQGSLIPAAWGNAVTKELLNVLQQADIEPDELDSGQVAAAILKMISEAGGMPRFTPYVWGGRGDAMPEGDTQSSGQQILDLMYPDMRADVVATQFTCTEAEWQADPYKRVTHWSLGDGVSWMRPPDKNGVQPGNVGAFYGVGSNPAGPLLGTAVADSIKAHKHAVGLTTNIPDSNYPVNAKTVTLTGAGGGTSFSAVTVSNDKFVTTFDGSAESGLATETKPRTWYGIWMIRMYGRVANTGLLDAPALNARMDMMDARVATLEGRHKALGDGQVRKTVTRSLNTNYAYPVDAKQSKEVRISAASVAANADVVVMVSRDGGATFTQEAVCVSIYYTTVTNLTARAIILPGEVYKFLSTNTTSVTFSEVS